MSYLLNPSRFAAHPSTMTIVQVKSASSNGASTNVVLDSPPNEGNTLLVFAGTTSNSATPNLIGDYTSIQNSSLVQGYFRTMWKQAGAGESATITATRSSSSTITQLTVVVVEISGLDVVSLVDQSASNDQSTGGGVSSMSSGTTGTTDQAAEMAVAFALWYDDDFTGAIWTNGFTGQHSGSLTSTNTAYGVSWAVATKALAATGAVETESDWSGGSKPEFGFGAVVTLRAA